MVKKWSDRSKGLLYLLLSAALYGTMPILSKLMYETGLNAVSVLLLRYFFSLLIMLGYLKIVRREPAFTSSPLAIIQGVTFIGGSLLYFIAINYLPAGLITSIFYIYPAIVSVLAIIVYHEKVSGRQFVALTLALLGIIVISGLLSEAAHRLSLLGIALVIGSSVCYSFYTLIGQKTSSTTGALPLTTTLSLCGFVILALVFPRELMIVPHLQLDQVLLGVVMALLNTVLSVIFFLKGLALTGASRAAIVSTAEPAFTLLFAFILLGETITPLQGLGVLLVLTSTTLAPKHK